MLLNSPTDGNLLANFCAGGRGQRQLGGIGLDTQDLGTGGGGTNVDHQNLILSQLGNLSLLAVGSLDTQKAAKQEVVDLDLGVDGGKLAAVAQNETDETISTACEMLAKF